MRSDEQQVVRIKRELDEMLQKNTLNKRRLMDLLDKLAATTVDTELLQHTQVGRTVNSVRKAYASSRDINQKALQLIKKWKGLVKSEHGRRKSVSSVQSEEGAKSPDFIGAEVQISSPESSTIVSDDNERDQQFSPVIPPSGDDDGHMYFHFGKNEQDGPKAAKIGRSDSVSSAASTDDTSESGGNGSKTKDDKRSKSVELLHQALISGEESPSKPHPLGKTPLDLASEIERCIYEEIGNANDRHYAARIRSRVINLRDKRNPTLRNNVLTGKLSTKRLSTMSVDEMANEHLKRLRRSLEEESIKSREIGTDNVSSRTDLYPCDQCGKRDASYAVTQERVEGDYEPIAITQVVCNGCGHRWRVY